MAKRTPLTRTKAMKALELRTVGLSLQDISHQLGYSGEKAVWKAINDLLNRMERETVAAYKMYQLARLDQALSAVWQNVLSGNSDAIQAFLKIEDRRSKLMGLDAPRLIAPVTPEGKSLPLSVKVYIPDNKRNDHK